MLQAGEYQALADRVGFTLEAAAAVARAWGLKPGERRRSDPTLTERERYPTVTTKEGRTYAAPEWPDD